MISLLIMIVFALLVSFFALQNTTGATITLATYTFRNIPLYFIVIGSILAGITMSLVINIFQTLSSSITMRQKNTTIKGARHTITDLQTKIHELEIENARLKGEQHIVTTKPESEHETSEEKIHHKPSLFQRLRHNIST